MRWIMLIMWLMRRFKRRKVKRIIYHSPPVVIPSPKMLPKSLKMLTPGRKDADHS